MGTSVLGGYFANIIQYLIDLENIKVSLGAYYDLTGMTYIYNQQALWYFILSFAFFVVMYVFMGIGLYKLSKVNGVSNPILSFVPFARYFQMGKLVGEIRLFGKPTKNMGLIVMIVAIVEFVLKNVYDVVAYAEPFFEIIKTNTLPESIPENVYMMLLRVIGYAGDIAFFVLFIFLVVALFRSYERKHPILYSVLGALFNLTGVFVFVIRNHKKFDYMEEMRRRYYGRYYGDPSGGNGYNGYNGYNNNYSDLNNNGNSNGSPSSRSSGSENGDVFEEYSDKDGQGNNGNSGDYFN